MKKIAITSTIPLEIPYSAGYKVIDLNNIFITDSNREELTDIAHKRGFQRTVCGWTKGLYGAVKKHGFDKIINVVQGDCSNNHVLGDILTFDGLHIIPFSYPDSHDRIKLKSELDRLSSYFNVSLKDYEKTFEKFRTIRKNLMEIDKLTYIDGKVTGIENLQWLISGSDLRGNPSEFQQKIIDFLEISKKREKKSHKIRIGMIGVPPMYDDLHDFIERFDAKIVYNETAVEFGRVGDFDSILENYYSYSYPYELDYRLNRINEEIKKREIDYIIHYTQSFCFHGNEHKYLSENISIPVLKIENDSPKNLDESTKIRIESFIKSFNSKTANTNTYNLLTVYSYLGIDFGSRNVKLLLEKDGKQYQGIIDSIKFIRNFMYNKNGVNSINLENLVNYFWSDLNININELFVISTGYGRHEIKWKNAEVIPEINAHSYGVLESFPELKDFTLLDLGGQDTKVIKIVGRKTESFIMNDKCAAGGGRYLENMCSVLDISLNEIGNYYENAENLDVTCATFGETELIGKMIKGVDINKLASGVNYSVYKRSLFLVNRLYSKVLVLSGGVAKNSAIVKMFQESQLFEKVLVVNEPQFAGAKGCISYIKNSGGDKIAAI